MSILVTGGTGFIGSNFILYMIKKYPDLHIVNLDKLTYASDIRNLETLKNCDRYSFVHGDICDKSLLVSLFDLYNFDGVIHFAAESHVDNSIANPGAFIETNVNGTYILLGVARKFWMVSANQYKKEYELARFYHISTDEVYGTLGEEGYFTEETSYAPNSPYSASKAASDFIVRSYYHTYGMNIVTTNCSNNFGPRQRDEKLIPTVIRNAISFNSIPIYGDGKNVRDWLYVEDHCRAIDLVYHNGRAGETYLIGGKNEQQNLDIVMTILDILDIELKHLLIEKGLSSFKELIEFVDDRPGHDFRYAINSNKIAKELGWRAVVNFDNAMISTVKWYISKYTKATIVGNRNGN